MDIEIKAGRVRPWGGSDPMSYVKVTARYMILSATRAVRQAMHKEVSEDLLKDYESYIPSDFPSEHTVSDKFLADFRDAKHPKGISRRDYLTLSLKTRKALWRARVKEGKSTYSSGIRSARATQEVAAQRAAKADAAKAAEAMAAGARAAAKRAAASLIEAEKRADAAKQLAVEVATAESKRRLFGIVKALSKARRSKFIKEESVVRCEAAARAALAKVPAATAPASPAPATSTAPPAPATAPDDVNMQDAAAAPPAPATDTVPDSSYDDCPVCMEPMGKQVMVLRCAHSACATCIHQMDVTYRSQFTGPAEIDMTYDEGTPQFTSPPQCPICREAISTAELTAAAATPATAPAPATAPDDDDENMQDAAAAPPAPATAPTPTPTVLSFSAAPRPDAQLASVLWVEIYKHWDASAQRELSTLFILEQYTLDEFTRLGAMNALLMLMCQEAPGLCGTTPDQVHLIVRKKASQQDAARQMDAKKGFEPVLKAQRLPPSTGVEARVHTQSYLGSSFSDLRTNLTSKAANPDLELVLRHNFRSKGFAFERRTARAIEAQHRKPRDGDGAALTDLVPMYQAAAPMVMSAFFPEGWKRS